MQAEQALKHIQTRIQLACKKSGRSETEVKLLAVSKTFPAASVLEFAKLGQQAFGENYLQEAIEKITQLAEDGVTGKLEWHFIGPIQSNKTRAIAEHFDWVHSVDRLKIAERLADQRPDSLGKLNTLVQVNTSGESSKSGIEPGLALELAHQIQSLPMLVFRGFMTIPAPTDNTEQLRHEFVICKKLLQTAQESGLLQADTLSMGMSADLETAIDCGSTMIRVGTALFGQRS